MKICKTHFGVFNSCYPHQNTMNEQSFVVFFCVLLLRALNR